MAIQPDPTTSPVTITGLTPNTAYTIQVRAKAEQGMATMYGDWSSEITATTTLVLSQPQNVTAESQPVAGDVLVSWDAVMNATQYEVQYCSGVCTTQTWTNLGSETSATNSETINNLTPASTYSFRVRASSPAQSVWSDIQTHTVALIAPVTLALTVSNTTINALWTPVAGATSYDIWHCTGSCTSDSDYTKATSTVTRYSITGITLGATYSVKVRGTYNSVQGLFLEQNVSSSLPQITGLTVSATTSSTISADWDGWTGATGYTVQHRHRIPDPQNPGDIAWSSATNVSRTARSVQLTGLNPSARYELLVTALNSSNTPIAQSSPLITNTEPNQISGVVATAASTTQLNVSWNALTQTSGVEPAGILNYDLRYRTGSNAWTGMNSVTQTTQTQLTGLTAGTSYEIQVSARMSVIEGFSLQRIDIVGDWSSTATQTTNQAQAILTPPTNVAVTQGASNTEISVSWDTQAAADDLCYPLQSSRNIVLDKKIPPTTSPATITGLMEGTSYEIVVRARNSNGAGEFSNAITFTTPMPDDMGMPQGPGGSQDSLTQVTNVMASTTTTNTELMISWDTQAEATGYDVGIQNNRRKLEYVHSFNKSCNLDTINRKHRV